MTAAAVVEVPPEVMARALTRHPDGARPCKRCEVPQPLESFWIGGRWRGDCHTCFRKTSARRALDRYHRDPAAAIKRQAMKRYDLTEEEYDALLEITECSICGETTDSKNMHIDHDHETGKVRGRLCGICNRGLGLFRDDPIRLRAAAAYIEENR